MSSLGLIPNTSSIGIRNVFTMAAEQPPAFQARTATVYVWPGVRPLRTKATPLSPVRATSHPIRTNSDDSAPRSSVSAPSETS